MSKEFDHVILSKIEGMPVTLLFDERYRNITDEQYEDIKNYIRQMIDGEEQEIKNE